MSKFKINYKNNFINKIQGGVDSPLFTDISQNKIWVETLPEADYFINESDLNQINQNYDLNKDLTEIQQYIKIYKDDDDDDDITSVYRGTGNNIKCDVASCKNFNIYDSSEYIYIYISDNTSKDQDEKNLFDNLINFAINLQETYHKETLENLVYFLNLNYKYKYYTMQNLLGFDFIQKNNSFESNSIYNFLNDNKKRSIVLIGHWLGSIYIIYLYIILIYIIKAPNVKAFTFGGVPLFPLHLINDISRRNNFYFIKNLKDFKMFHINEGKCIDPFLPSTSLFSYNFSLFVSTPSTTQTDINKKVSLPKFIYTINEIEYDSPHLEVNAFVAKIPQEIIIMGKSIYTSLVKKICLNQTNITTLQPAESKKKFFDRYTHTEYVNSMRYINIIKCCDYFDTNVDMTLYNKFSNNSNVQYFVELNESFDNEKAVKDFLYESDNNKIIKTDSGNIETIITIPVNIETIIRRKIKEKFLFTPKTRLPDKTDLNLFEYGPGMRVGNQYLWIPTPM